MHGRSLFRPHQGEQIYQRRFFDAWGKLLTLSPTPNVPRWGQSIWKQIYSCCPGATLPDQEVPGTPLSYCIVSQFGQLLVLSNSCKYQHLKTEGVWMSISLKRLSTGPQNGNDSLWGEGWIKAKKIARNHQAGASQTTIAVNEETTPNTNDLDVSRNQRFLFLAFCI